jgi:hypothetical protein
LIDIVADAGSFVAASLLQLSESLNKRVLGTSGVITPKQMVEEFKAVTGKDAKFVHLTYDQFKGFLPPAAAEELVGTMQLIEDPGYYVGEPAGAIQESIDFVAKAGLSKPITWKEFVAKHFQG